MRTIAAIFVGLLCFIVLIPYAGDVGRYLAAWLPAVFRRKDTEDNRPTEEEDDETPRP